LLKFYHVPSLAENRDYLILLHKENAILNAANRPSRIVIFMYRLSILRGRYAQSNRVNPLFGFL
jgi:hypothetical protein